MRDRGSARVRRVPNCGRIRQWLVVIMAMQREYCDGRNEFAKFANHLTANILSPPRMAISSTFGMLAITLAGAIDPKRCRDLHPGGLTG